MQPKATHMQLNITHNLYANQPNSLNSTQLSPISKSVSVWAFTKIQFSPAPPQYLNARENVIGGKNVKLNMKLFEEFSLHIVRGNSSRTSTDCPGKNNTLC